MPGRFRSETGGFNSLGSIHSNGYGSGWMNYLSTTSDGKSGCASFRRSMTDTTSPRPYPDHALVADQAYNRQPIRLNGETQSPIFGWKYRFNNFCPENFLRTEDYWLPPPTMDFPAQYLITKALANVNPSVPDVSVPNFIFEFKDFPRMLRNAGDILSGLRRPSKGINPKNANDGYLAWQFGWAPLISDLSKLVDTAKLIEKRMASFKKHAGGGKVHRRLGGRSTTHSVSEGNWMTGEFTYTRWYITDSEDQQWWYSCDLYIPQSPPTRQSQWIPAAEAALGGHYSAATIWNAVPWSFLIDYFIDVNSFLNAIDGFIPHIVLNMCVMAKGTRRRQISPGTPNNGVSVTGGYAETITKRRSVVASPTPLIALRPFLTDKMVANMASLAAAAAFGGSKGVPRS